MRALLYLASLVNIIDVVDVVVVVGLEFESLRLEHNTARCKSGLGLVDELLFSSTFIPPPSILDVDGSSGGKNVFIQSPSLGVMLNEIVLGESLLSVVVELEANDELLP
jgi:hypothetical protein